MPYTKKLSAECCECGTVVKRVGERGRIPSRCPECADARRREYQRSRYVQKPKDSESREAAKRRATDAARARWDNTSADARSDIGRNLAEARWQGHEATHKVYASRPKTLRKCKFCGVERLMSAVQITCGAAECRLARNAERMKKYNKSRRARRMMLPYETIDPAKIFERDGWVCHICEKPVDETLKFPDALSPSIDHVVPLSLGGHHVMENVKCSHLRCNLQKGSAVS